MAEGSAVHVRLPDPAAADAAPEPEPRPTTPPSKTEKKKGVNFDEVAIENDLVEKVIDKAARRNFRRGGTTHWKFEGAAEKILNFLDQRKDMLDNPLPRERYVALRKAVIQLSDGEKQSTFHDKSITDLMSAFGMNLDQDQDIINSYHEEFNPTQSLGHRHSIDDNAAEDLLQEEGWDVHAFMAGPFRNKDIGVLLYMFESPFDLVQRYNLNTMYFTNWIKAMKGLYRDENPYHNWSHALEVTQMARYAVVTGGGDFLNYQDVFSLFCASIAHDVGHYGLTTPFLQRTSNELALLYNDKSPMENMHASVFFETMLKDGHQFFQPAKASQWKNFRRKVIAAILSTDISQHFDFVGRLNTRVGKLEFNPFIEDRSAMKEKDNVSKEDRMLLLEAFMHTADLTHNFKPFNVHKIGLACLESEWFNQGDMEAKAGLPISPNNDRTKDSATGCQHFFLGSMVRPLLVGFHTFTKEEYAESILLSLDTNTKCWQKAIAEHGKGKTVNELVQILPDTFGEDVKEKLFEAAEERDPPKT